MVTIDLGKVKGDPGVTPQLTIGTVGTGEPGSLAQASITGTPENPILNLVIPKGDKGESYTANTSNNYFNEGYSIEEAVASFELSGYSLKSFHLNVFTQAASGSATLTCSIYSGSTLIGSLPISSAITTSNRRCAFFCEQKNGVWYLFARNTATSSDTATSTFIAPVKSSPVEVSSYAVITKIVISSSSTSVLIPANSTVWLYATNAY